MEITHLTHVCPVHVYPAVVYEECVSYASQNCPVSDCKHMVGTESWHLVYSYRTSSVDDSGAINCSKVDVDLIKLTIIERSPYNAGTHIAHTIRARTSSSFGNIFSSSMSICSGRPYHSDGQRRRDFGLTLKPHRDIGLRERFSDNLRIWEIEPG